MKKILFGLAAMASLTLTACGGNYCDDAESASKDLVKKAKECGLEITDPGEATDAERDACKKSLDSCSDADKDKLDSYVSCVNDVKSCSDKSSSQQQAFSAALVACSAHLSGLSTACTFAD